MSTAAQHTRTARTAIITGGARGIGFAIAKRLADDGGLVAIWDRAGAQAAADLLGPGHIGIDCDITSEQALDRAAEMTWVSFGRVDGLVCNAGILGPVAPLWEQPVEAFNRVMAVNAGGTFLTLRAAVPRMLAQSGPDKARIVTIASIQGKEGMPLAGAYAASKAAIIAMTKTIGKELAEKGILVNAITPAAAETDMATEISADRRAEIVGRIPMGRFVAVEEIAAMTAWLLSHNCSFSTGAAFDLSGGRATY